MATVRYLDRKLVRNILRHTETHNRLQEEDEMWRNRAMQAFGWRMDSRRSRGRGRGHRGRPGMMGRNRDQSWQRQMERIQRMNPDTQAKDQDRRNWNSEHNRNIYRAELGNQERWGHTGFMELYPEEFLNKESMDEMSDEEDAERKKEKTKTKYKRKSIGDRKDSKSNKHRKVEEKPGSASESDSSDADDSGEEETRPVRRKKARSAGRRKASGDRAKHHSASRSAPSFDRTQKTDAGDPRAGDGRVRTSSGGHENSHRRQGDRSRDGSQGRKRQLRDDIEKRPERDAEPKHKREEKAGKQEELKHTSQKRRSHKGESHERRTDPSLSKRDRHRTVKRSAAENGDSSPAEHGDENSHRLEQKYKDDDPHQHRHRHHHHKSSRKGKKKTDSESKKDKHHKRK